MGAWDFGAFGNDTACDWSYELEKAKDLSFVERTLKAALIPENDYLDADIASEAIAACEVIARLHGKMGVSDSYTARADKWIASHPSKPSLSQLGMALKVIDRVLQENSELKSLWDESGEDDWLQEMEGLRNRLS